MSFFKKYYKLLILIIAIMVIFFSPLRDYIDIDKMVDILNKVKNDPYAPVIYVLFYIGGVVLFLPGMALTLLSGVLFGFWKALILVVIGSNVGCQITFFISRFLGRDFVQKFIKAESFIDKVSEKIKSNGFLVIFYLRIIPLFPFNMTNYVSGLTPVKYKDYTFATFFGMLPATILYTYLASSATDIKDNYTGIIIAVVALILFTVIISFIKRRQKLFKEEKSGD